MNEESMVKSESFARKIIFLAANEKLTVCELCSAADMAKNISCNSTVEEEAVEKTDFPATLIAAACNENRLFED